MRDIGCMYGIRDKSGLGYMSDKTDMEDKMDFGDISGYRDKDDFWVGIGTIVGYEEFFTNPDNEHKEYVVVKLPNYGDMVHMREIVMNCRDWRKSCIVDDTDIVVEPWRIGAI